MQRSRNPKTVLAVGMASAALLGAGGVIAFGAARDAGSDRAAAPQVIVGPTAQPAAQSSSLSVSDIYKQSAGSVVEITVSSVAQATPFGGGGGGGEQQGQGSGFVYGTGGYVITNQHVVDGADSVKVQFSNGKSYDATVVGTDPSTDIAVLKVDAPKPLLDPLELADSATVEVGEGVVAIGSPFGLEQTVTTGIVSAVNRQITSPNNFAIDNAIQTDAAINKGNSGGPLLDLTGAVIGVNTQIESQSGGNDGIGFAVPSNTVEKIANALIADGSVEYAYLGVTTEDAAGVDGASIAQVRTGTPAASAGLQAGDLVTKLDGTAVGSADELRRLIAAKSPGDTVELTVRRGGKTKTLDVKLGSRPAA